MLLEIGLAHLVNSGLIDTIDDELFRYGSGQTKCASWNFYADNQKFTFLKFVETTLDHQPPYINYQLSVVDEWRDNRILNVFVYHPRSSARNRAAAKRALVRLMSRDLNVMRSDSDTA
ncbi:hypothetical protein C8Q80DRAFT_1271254 [Daedaleopsis nitida]|nr:hypothetical protein C8Q80DRAFT_1271254 [Daedaleopsis nitida]